MKRILTNNVSDLRVEVQMIDVSSWGPVPDESWRWVDAAGHGHFYDKGYPTLREITETVSEDGDEWDQHVRWECPHCGEHISPPRRDIYYDTQIPGAKRYLIGESEVTRQEFIEAWRVVQQRQIELQEQAL